MDKTNVAITDPQSPEEAASLRGYNDCKKSNKFDSASGIPESYYAPVAGYETQYQAGWDKAQKEEDKKTVRRTAVGRLIIGASLLIVGIAGFIVGFSVLSSRGNLSGMLVWKYTLGAAGLAAFYGLGLFIWGLVSTLSGRDLDDK